MQVPLTLEAEGGQLMRAMQVQCGAMHTLVLVQSQGRLEVRSAGDNSYGQLGLGDRAERHRFHPIPQLQVRHFALLAARHFLFHHCAVAISAWGAAVCGTSGACCSRGYLIVVHLWQRY